MSLWSIPIFAVARVSLSSARASAALVLALWCALVFSASPAAAADPAGLTEQPGPASSDPWERFPPAWEAALRTTGDDALYLLTSPLRLTPEKAAIVGAIGAGIGGLSLADRAIRKEARHPQEDTLRDAANAVSLLGFAPVLLGLNAGAIVVGEGIREYSGNPKHLDTALVAVESQILALAFSEAIAFAVARSRPPGSGNPFRFEFGNASFPSSHASQAFAVAAVLSDRYEQPVPIIAYGLAGLVGVSRLIQDKHWASDVAAGAVLGWAIGKALSVRHGKPHGYLDFFPFADPVTQRYGLLLKKEF